MIRHVPSLDGFLTKMDDVWGYGRQDATDKWWFDLEVVGGVLRIPKRSRDDAWEQTESQQSQVERRV